MATAPSGDTVLSMTALTMSVFGFFLPSIQDVRKKMRDAETEDEVKSGLMLASIVVLGSVLVASLFSNNYSRLWIASATVLALGAIYQYQLGDQNGIPALSGVLGSRA